MNRLAPIVFAVVCAAVIGHVAYVELHHVADAVRVVFSAESAN